MHQTKLGNSFRLGYCLIQPSTLSIQLDGCEKQTLQPKFVEVISYLAEHYPRVIPRQELIDTIWNGNDSVGEKALTNAVWHLRQHLKSPDAEKEIIETIRKVGYRLVIAPQWLDEVGAPASYPAKPDRQPDHRVSGRDGTSITKGLLKFVAYSVVVPCSILLSWYYLTQYEPIQEPDIQRVTTDPGSELYVAPSPDGRYIVYHWRTFGQPINLFMRDLEQPQMPARQLTFDNLRQRFSVWSNDGQYLYFHRRNRLQSSCEILQIKVDTNQEKPIASCGLNSGFIYMDISPDDRILAFQGYDDKTNSRGIYFVELDNPGAEAVRFSCTVDCDYTDRDMAFSPDGQHIAVTRRRNSYDENIYLVDLATKNARQLTEGEENITGLTWHTDSTKLVYATERADVSSGYIIDIHSKKIHSLNIDGFGFPAYSRKTGELFYEQRVRQSKILSLQLNNTVSRTPFPVVESKFSHHSPNYSKRMDKIVYVSNESGHYELWTADSDGRNRQQLSRLKTNVRYPRWSNGDSRVVFIGQAESNRGDAIYIMDTESGKLSTLSTDYDDFDRPSWSYDDSAIVVGVYENSTSEIYQFDIDNGTARQLTADSGRFGIMTTPTTLVYTRHGRGLWQRDIDTDAPPVEKIDSRVFSHPYAWTYAAGGVYFRRNRSDHHQIIHYDFDQQRLTTLVRLPIRTFRSYGTLSFLPQEGKLLYAGTEYPQADIKKMKHPLLP
ncbi:winged helix-turn-helix domain-containing protein [Exilibacterium tricleocarpae]|nr:winged helix-turn-helix domain-containing protein [Exilibacterium tricleocarpae]